MYKGFDRASGASMPNLGVPPGSADLTLKIKDVNPEHIPRELALADSACKLGAESYGDHKKPRLKVKVGDSMASLLASCKAGRHSQAGRCNF